jgi:hypothetical protein
LKRFIIVGTLIACASVGQAAEQGKSASVLPPRVQDQRGTEQNPIFVKGAVATSIPPSPPAATPEEIARDQQKVADDHLLAVATNQLAIWTGILVFVAVVQAVMFFWQLRLTRAASKDAHAAADAAKASADALPRIERAYLFADISFVDLTVMRKDAEYDMKILVRITNHGKTPAVLTSFRCYPLWHDQAPQQLLPHREADRKMPEGLAISSTPFEWIIKENIDHERYTDLCDVVRHLYVVGLVKYKDVLGDERETGFCWNTYPTADGTMMTISPSSLNYFR